MEDHVVARLQFSPFSAQKAVNLVNSLDDLEKWLSNNLLPC